MPRRAPSITGGAGFIGSHLAERLLARRLGGLRARRPLHRVGAERRSSARAPRLPSDRRLGAEVVGRERARASLRRRVSPRGRGRRPADRRRACAHARHEHPGNGDRPRPLQPLRQARARRVHLGGLRRPARARAARRGGKRLYGPTTSRRWAYAESKALDEFLALAYHQERGLDCVIVRLFNTVGPRQSGQYGMVIPRFVSAALAGRPLEIHGDGTQTRCFCHVQDTIRALTRLMDADDVVGRDLQRRLDGARDDRRARAARARR